METLGRIDVTSLFGTVTFAGVDTSKRKHMPIFVLRENRAFYVGSAPCPQYVTKKESDRLCKRFKFWKAGFVLYVRWIEIPLDLNAETV